MSPKKEICENVTIIKDDIQLEVKHKNGEFNVLIEGEEYIILKRDESFNVFQKLSQSNGNSILENIKKKEEEKFNLQVKIKRQESEKEHCNEFHAQPQSIPCPLPRVEVEKLFKSLGLTPPEIGSSDCTPSLIGKEE